MTKLETILKEFEKRFGYWFKDPMNENLDKGCKKGLKFFLTTVYNSGKEEGRDEVDDIIDEMWIEKGEDKTGYCWNSDLAELEARLKSHLTPIKSLKKNEN